MKPRHVHDKNGVMCNHVQKGKRPARIVAHDAEGIWQFMCGLDDHTPKSAKTVCIDCALAKHGGGLTREQVPPGHIARRSSSRGAWSVREMNDLERAAIEDRDAAADPDGASPG